MGTNDYAFIYLEISILCFIICTIILAKISDDMGSNWVTKAFAWMPRLFLIMLVLDGITQMHYLGVFSFPKLLVCFCYSSYMWLLGVLAFIWLFYTEQEIGGKLCRSRMFWRLICIPFIILFVISFGSIKWGWLYYLDANGLYHRGPLYAWQTLLSYPYFIFATIHSFIIALKEKVTVRRKKLINIATFLIAPTAGSILQVIVGGYPILPPSICIAIMFIFVSLQGDLINLDALTQLNNRKSADKYLEEIIAKTTEATPFYLYMIDVDDFKSINDTMGHMEGDHALKVIAEALRISIDEFKGFAARFGGDEFLAVIAEKNIDAPEVFKTEINNRIAELTATEMLDFPLSISIGFAECNSPAEDPEDLIAKADAMLYNEKYGKEK